MNLLALAAEHSSGAHTFDYRHLGRRADIAPFWALA